MLGWRTDELPLFYSAHGGPAVSARVETAAEAARVARAHWELRGGGLLLGRPPDESLDDVEPLIEPPSPPRRSRRARAGGDAVRPLLSPRESGGRTLAANRDLIVGNARLAAEIARRRLEKVPELDRVDGHGAVLHANGPRTAERAHLVERQALEPVGEIGRVRAQNTRLAVRLETEQHGEQEHRRPCGPRLGREAVG